MDRLLVRESQGVGFTLHPAEKHPSNPVVRADRPWEGWRLEIYGNVIYDEEEKVFKMWYLGEGGDHFSFEYPTLYAVSADGIEWEKPEVGTLRAVKGDPFKHNAVGQLHLAGVMKDRGDTHTGSIGLARWKLDRFVSVDGPGEGGTLTTIRRSRKTPRGLGSLECVAEIALGPP